MVDLSSKKQALFDKPSMGINLFIRAALLFLVIIVFQACQNVNLERVEGTVCSFYKSRYNSSACVFKGQGVDTYDYKQTLGQVDLLFVVDESNSMAADQREIGDRFATLFTQGLLSNLDYQVGMTLMTKGKEGTLVPFGSSNILKKGRALAQQGGAQIEALFSQTIKRPESQKCEDIGSRDFSDACLKENNRDIERGICSARRAISNPVWRPSAHMAVVFLTDENGPSPEGKHYDSCDDPYDFLDEIDQKTSLNRRLMSFHSIVVSSASCQATRKEELMSKQSVPRSSGAAPRAVPKGGEIGNNYISLSQGSGSGRVKPGQVISICANNYANSLGRLGLALQDYQRLMALPCELTSTWRSQAGIAFPQDQVLQVAKVVRIVPESGGKPVDTLEALVEGSDYEVEDNQFVKITNIEIPLHSLINIKMLCPITAKKIIK